MIWLWAALKLVPEIESLVLNIGIWNRISVRESFSTLHLQSQVLAEIGLSLTLVLPWLSQVIRMEQSKTEFMLLSYFSNKVMLYACNWAN